MGKLYLMTTIVDRKAAKKYSELYWESGQHVAFVTLGFGTASNDILDYLGMENTGSNSFPSSASLGTSQEKSSFKESLRLTHPEGELLLSCRLAV